MNTSDYITAKEAATGWGVSRRYVNMCIEDGRVPDAVRIGNMWLIPRGTNKPLGLRRENSRLKDVFSSDLAFVITATTRPMPGINPDSILDIISEERLRLQYEGELAYLRGDFTHTISCYRKLGDDTAARLRAASAAIASAISLGDYPFYSEVETFLKDVKADYGASATAVAELSLATAYVSAIAPDMAPQWLKDGDFTSLPSGAKLDAAYKRSKYFQGKGQYHSMLAAAQTALSFCDPMEGVSHAGIYLRISCAMACVSLNQMAEAERYLLEAMKICLPHGFITPFAELVTGLGGLVERCLEQYFPEHYDAVTSQWKATFTNWITFHNRFTQNNITLILTPQEYRIAQLAASRVPYAKIAEQCFLSVGSVKNKMLVIYDKLFISGRDELSKYVFQPSKK